MPNPDQFDPLKEHLANVKQNLINLGLKEEEWGTIEDKLRMLGNGFPLSGSVGDKTWRITRKGDGFEVVC